MKNLPGIKIVGFFTIISTVALVVYAATPERPTPTPSPTASEVVIKIGHETGNPTEAIPASVDYHKVKKAAQEGTHNDKAKYKVIRYEDDQPKEQEGSRDSCGEPLMARGPGNAPTATPTATPAYPPGASPQPSAGNTKTQTTAVVALGSISDAKKFFDELSKSGGTKAKQPKK